jgi:hypothetical protein
MWPKKHLKSKGERSSENGPASNFDRFVIFASGAFLGLLAGRFMTPAAKEKRKLKESQQACGVVVASDGSPGEFSQAEEWSEAPAHERSDVSFPILGVFVAVLVLGAVVMHTSLWWWGRSKGGLDINAVVQQGGVGTGRPEGTEEFPRLQLSPQGDLREYLNKEQTALHSTNATNKNSVRIPIERAMGLMAEKGLPGWEDARTVSPLQLQQQRRSETGDQRR